MSISRNKKRKAARKAESAEKKRIRRLIKAGELPAFHFARGPRGELETNKIHVLSEPDADGKVKYTKNGLTCRLVSTLAVLTKDEK